MSACVVIGGFPGDSSLAVQFALMRGIRVCSWESGVRDFFHKADDPQSLYSITLDLLGKFDSNRRRVLKSLVNAGAILYVRGCGEHRLDYRASPLADVTFKIAPQTKADGYRFTSAVLVPSALRGEQVRGNFSIPGADGLERNVEPLLVARHDDGKERPSIFAVREGAGLIIYDLNHERSENGIPLVKHLADPVSRPSYIGAVMAADKTSAQKHAASAIDFVIDDRPVNYDFLSAARLRKFLQHMNGRFNGVHVDFGWTPDQTHPSRAYTGVLKSYNTGFVWHGLLRHIDHRTVSDPLQQLVCGRRLVAQIEHRYGVHFQPVMIFPFEKDTPKMVEVLRDEGFLAKSELAEGSAVADPVGEPQPGGSYAGLGERDQLLTIERHTVEELSRDVMLARATLGLPIVAMAHPGDVALRRVAFLKNRGSFSYFDSVLDFAAEKKLRPRSLEEIAQEIKRQGSMQQKPTERQLRLMQLKIA